MRIAFICGCLEPGRDGVGDYTRLLSAAVRAQGHDTLEIALRDEHTSQAKQNNRYLDALANPEERTHCLEQLRLFAPDWVSLQFVPYALHPRGLPRELPGFLREAAGHWRWQVMFHEIWIGCKRGAPLKERLMGMAQRHLIRRATHAIKPAVVHSHARPYRELLSKLGLPARPLPLFGNIPVALADGFGDQVDDALEKRLATVLGWSPDDSTPTHLGGIFGTLHPEWPPEPLLSNLRNSGKQHGRRIGLLHFGSIGSAGYIWNALLSANDDHLRLGALGRLSPEEASRLMQRLDFGVAASPRALIEKSGSATAMLEHGLPVLINRDDVSYPAVPPLSELPDPLLFDASSTLPANFFSLAKRPPASRLTAVAEQFLNDLSE